jgi:hypothetical protein
MQIDKKWLPCLEPYFKIEDVDHIIDITIIFDFDKQTILDGKKEVKLCDLQNTN